MLTDPSSDARSRIRRTRRRWAVAFGLTLLTLWGARRAAREVRTAAVLLRAAGGSGWLASVLDEDVTRGNVSVPFAGRMIRARIFRPSSSFPRRGIVVAHGVQFAGMDAERLVPFASALASAGFVVLTPEIEQLSGFRSEPQSVEQLRACVAWLADRPEVLRGGVGILGASFAGGLALLAASDPSIRRHVAWVISVGGHHDVATVMRHLATTDSDDYGLAVFVHAYAEHFVPPGDVGTFRAAVRERLRERPADARALAHSLSPDAAQLLDAIVRGDGRAVGRRVVAALPSLAPTLAALSPAGHLQALRGIRVLLLHGQSDRVIPASESLANAREIGDRWHTRTVLSGALTHVSLDRHASWWEQWRVVRAAAAVLNP